MPPPEAIAPQDGIPDSATNRPPQNWRQEVGKIELSSRKYPRKSEKTTDAEAFDSDFDVLTQTVVLVQNREATSG